jgi:tetratricopeptide (TPR) repeat protein
VSEHAAERLNEAAEIDDAGHHAAALPIWDEVIAAVGDSTDDDLRYMAGRAWLRKAHGLDVLGHAAASRAEYASAAERFADLPDIADDANSRLARHALDDGRPQEALDRLAALPRDAYNLLLEGLALADLRRSEDAIVSFDAAIADSGDDPDIQAIFSARAGKAVELRNLRRYDDCIETCRELVASATDPAVRNQAAYAFVIAGAVHANRGRTRAALTLYRQVLREFDRGETERIDELREWTRESIHIIHGTRVFKSLFWGGLAVVLAHEVISSRRT